MILLMECGGEGSSNELAALLRELPRELSGLGKERLLLEFRGCPRNTLFT